MLHDVLLLVPHETDNEGSVKISNVGRSLFKLECSFSFKMGLSIVSSF